MKNLLRTSLMLTVSVITSLVLFSSCNKDQEQGGLTEPVIPSISISDVKATSTTITFTVKPVDAVKYSYSVLPKGVQGSMTTVEDGNENTITVENLTPDTEYTISAVATSVDNFESDLVTVNCITNAKATVSISEITPTDNSVSVKFTPTNATGFRYAVTPEGEDPTEWTTVEGNSETTAEIKDLTPETAYTIHACAYNEEGDGEIITEGFTTLEAPKALNVELVATSYAVYMSFEFNPELADRYVFTYPTTKDSFEFTGIDGFLEHVVSNAWAYTDYTESYREVSLGFPSSTELFVYAVCKDKEGAVLPETALEISVTTKALSQLSGSTAKAELKSVETQSMTADFEISLSEECLMYHAGMIPAENIGDTPVNMYVNENLSSFQMLPVEETDFKTTVSNILPNKDYVAILFAADKNGDITALASEKVSTTEIEYDENSTAEINVLSSTFTSTTFSLVKNNCKDVRFLQVEKTIADASSDDDFYAQLYSPFSQVIMPGESGNFTIEWLNYNTEYILYTIPVKEDGSLGKPGKLAFSTGKYVQEGTSTATIEVLNIDRTDPSVAVAKVKVTPDASAGSFIYSAVSAEVYDLNKNRIADYVCSTSFTVVDPAVESEINVDMWFEDYYFIVIPIDKDGKYSAAVVSERLAFKE